MGVKLSIAVMGSLAIGCGAARSGALQEAEAALARNDCVEAEAVIGQAEQFGTPTDLEHAQMLYIRAKCQERPNEIADAIGLYRYILDHYSDSVYGYRARERLGDLVESESVDEAAH